MSDSTSPQWLIETEYVQSCNCAYGCPCNFNALPTYGNCEALLAYHVRKGNFGDTKLDGVTFAWGLWWPKAIHLGDGIGKRVSDQQPRAQQATVATQDRARVVVSVLLRYRSRSCGLRDVPARVRTTHLADQLTDVAVQRRRVRAERGVIRQPGPRPHRDPQLPLASESGRR